MLRVSSRQFSQYAVRLQEVISRATHKELVILKPSIIHLQKQADSDDRLLQAVCILQDYNAYKKELQLWACDETPTSFREFESETAFETFYCSLWKES